MTACISILCVAALVDPTGWAAGAVVLAPSEEARAQRLLNPARSRAPAIAAGRAAAERALAQGPTRATAWLDLAYAETLRAGALTNPAREALRRSWIFEPLGPDNSQWRVRFAFEHWSELTPDLRDSALAEARAVWRTGHYADMTQALSDVRDPAGRLAAVLLFNELSHQAERDQRKRGT
jgi:hypothetical protein